MPFNPMSFPNRGGSSVRHGVAAAAPDYSPIFFYKYIRPKR